MTLISHASAMTSVHSMATVVLTTMTNVAPLVDHYQMLSLLSYQRCS